MASFCIPKELSKKFVSAIRGGKISPEQLAKMTPEQRREYLNSYFGESTEGLNKLIEKDLLQKDKKSYITDDEVKNISEMAKEIQVTKEKITPDMPNGSKERLDYGTARAVFQEYVGELKTSNKKPIFYIKNPKEAFIDLSGAVKSTITSLDNSFFGRQGLKVLFTNPSTWYKGFKKSWSDIGKELKGQDAMIPIKADVLSRQNALNGKYKQAKLAVDVLSEEAYPSSLPEKIPMFGRLFKASESAFNGAALRLRSDLFDKYIKKAEEMGMDIDDPVRLESYGKLVNSLTGRGNIGKLEGISPEVNATFFSVKFLKSNFDTLTAHLLDPKMSTETKKIAANNLAKIVTGIATTLYVAEQMQPGSVETDPTSANFGKIKIGSTRFDVTGGMASMVTLAMRLMKNQTKSSNTGKVTKLGTGKFGSRTRWDVVGDYFEGKLSPVAGVIRDYMKGEDYDGNKPTVKSTVENLVTPMPIQDLQELLDNPDSANVIMSMIASGLGISISTY